MTARRYYLDNCASTMLDTRVAQAISRAMTDVAGNPSSIHHEGQRTARALAQARATVADSLGARPPEIVLTSSGTEANNLAVRGVISHAVRTTGSAHVVTSTVEHASVSTALKWEQRLLGDRLRVTQVPVDGDGALDLPALDAALAGDDVSLVSLLYVNNETGVIQDLDALKARKLAHPAIPWHLDLVQAYTRLPWDVRLLPFDLLAVSAHKIHGPMGVGALYVRGGTAMDALLVGGAQEKYRRAGTENLLGAIGLAEAVQIAPSPEERSRHLTLLETEFLGALHSLDTRFRIQGAKHPGARRLPGFLNLSFPGAACREDLQIALDLEGVSLSSTSACHSGVSEPSHVLRAMGITGEALEGAIRLQFDYSHTPADAADCAAIMSRVLGRLTQTMELA